MFNKEIETKLQEKLNPSVVRQRTAFGEGNKQLSYLEGWYVQEQLNKIFGHGGWSQQVVSLNPVGVPYTVSKTGKNGSYENTVVVWQAVVRLDIHTTDESGNVHIVRREDVGVGVGEGTNLAAIQEKTIKEAVTDGIKRAAKSLGYPLGLALYDKDQENVMSPEEVRLSDQQALINGLMIQNDVSGVSAWFKNNQQGLLKGKEKYPNLSGKIDDMLKQVEDYLKENQPQE